MTEENDHIYKEYFQERDKKNYREYKRKKQERLEREKLEREKEEAQHSANEQSEEKEEYEGIIDPIGTEIPGMFDEYNDSLDSEEYANDFPEFQNYSEIQHAGVHNDENDAVEGVSEELFEEDPPYQLKWSILNLDKIVKHSRKRSAKDPELTLHTEDRYDPIAETAGYNLSNMFDDSSIMTIFHKFSYPEDYTWTQGYRVFEDDDCSGCVEEVLCNDDVDLEDNENISISPKDIDVDVECELNFQKLLQQSKDLLGRLPRNYKIKYSDICLKIPDSQREKVTSYEIRLIDFMVKQGVFPRVSICICRDDVITVDRSFFRIHYLWFGLRD